VIYSYLDDIGAIILRLLKRKPDILIADQQTPTQP
jgi:hypothetical protein